MVTFFEPLSPPSLDPRNERSLVTRCMDRVYTTSGGRLNDLSTSSPARALIEGQALAGAELLYYLNQLPEAFAIRFFQIEGIQRRLGSFAAVTLTFTLEKPLGNAFTIPAGFICSTSNAIEFATDAVLTIPPGFTAGDISATARRLGEEGNVGAFSISTFSTPLSFLKSVTNREPATGGQRAETIPEVKSRAFAVLRRRGLVTKDDYEQETISFLGNGAIAFAVGNLGADGTSYQVGTCHVFVLNQDGSVLNSAQLSDLQAHLTRKTHLGVGTYVSNINIVDVDVECVIEVSAGTDPSATAQRVYNRLDSYLVPGKLALGADILIKETEYQVRLASGVSTVNAVGIGTALSETFSTNYQLPNHYSAAKLYGCVVTVVQGNQNYTYVYGDGDRD